MLGFFLFPTALGRCAVAYGDQGIVATALPSQTEAATVRSLLRLVRARNLEEPEPERTSTPPPFVIDAAKKLTSLLDGAEVDLSDLPLDTRNLSDFRARIYAAARAIPCGARASYGELARAAGSPSAARAVGRAMATNPFPLIVPCHRVVAQGGELHGFSAPGGLRTKAALLDIEQRAAPAPSPSKAIDKALRPRRAGAKRTERPMTGETLPLFRSEPT